ncbi:hypothetical protein EG329_011777 [Mollisiaceae sp. DMI_Dod_QoI]|nr:hypothetical protein EG329_011777 [Helotiales sp. DMI_Dod_QoI]
MERRSSARKRAAGDENARPTRGSKRTRQPQDAEAMFANPKDPVYNMSTTELAALFVSPEAQSAVEHARPDLVQIHNSMIARPRALQKNITNFIQDGRTGFYDPEWLRQAVEAYKRHRNGDFDEFIKFRLYQDWPALEEKAKAEVAAAAVQAAQEQAEQSTIKDVWEQSELAAVQEQHLDAPDGLDAPGAPATQSGQNHDSSVHDILHEQRSCMPSPHSTPVGQNEMKEPSLSPRDYHYSEDPTTNDADVFRNPGKDNDDDDEIIQGQDRRPEQLTYHRNGESDDDESHYKPSSPSSINEIGQTTSPSIQASTSVSTPSGGHTYSYRSPNESSCAPLFANLQHPPYQQHSYTTKT